MHARTSLKAHRPVSGVARSTAAAHCKLLLHAIHTQQSCGCCTDSVSSVASTLGRLEPGLVAKAKIGHGEGRRSPRGSTARVLARQAPSANLMLTGRDQSSSCQTKSSQDQQKMSFHFQVNSKLRHDVTSLCHVNRCLTYIYANF